MDYSDFLSDLEEFLSEEEKKSLGINEEADHIINDKSQANYFVKLSKDCEAEMQALKDFVAEEKQRYNDLLEKFLLNQLESISRKKRYYDGALEDYAVRELMETNKKSIKLPYGTLAIKKQQPQYEYDEAAMLEWAKQEAPEFIKTSVKETINKSEIKKLGTVKDGELYISGTRVPGVFITDRDDKFEVK